MRLEHGEIISERKPETRNHHKKPSHNAEIERCSKTMGASAYHTALDFQTVPDALAEPSEEYVDAPSAVSTRYKQRFPVEPERRRRHRRHKHHRHRRISPDIVPPAKQSPGLLGVPGMPEVQTDVSVYPDERAGPHLPPPSAQQSGGRAAARNDRGTSTAATSRSDATTSWSKSSKGIGRESEWPTDREAITCLEACIAFVALVCIGVLVLFISFESGVWPFHGRATPESRTSEEIGGRRLSEAPVPYSSHHASSAASTEDAYVFSSASMPGAAKRATETPGENSTNTTAVMYGNAQSASPDAVAFAQ